MYLSSMSKHLPMHIHSVQDGMYQTKTNVDSGSLGPLGALPRQRQYGRAGHIGAGPGLGPVLLFFLLFFSFGF